MNQTATGAAVLTHALAAFPEDRPAAPLRQPYQHLKVCVFDGARP